MLAARRNRYGSRRQTLVRSSGVAIIVGVGLTRHVCRGASLDYPMIGCYADGSPRAMPRQLQPGLPLTKEGCASACIADKGEDEPWKFFGIEFGQECFCGNRYDTYGKAEDPEYCHMTLEAEPHVNAGGDWYMSVYDLQDYTTSNVVAGSASSNSSPSSSSGILSSGEPDDIGGDTPVDDNPRTPVPSGDRAFTVVNECSQTIRVGATGGRITFSSGDASSEALCDAWGPSSVYNPGPMGIGCYWAFPDEESGKGRELGPGEFARYNLHATEGDTRWSGTIWASTGCDKVDGCATGVCYSPDTNYVCPAYVGPGGPTTKAEFTLSDGGKDYYDVSMIDGINLPMQIEPDNPHLPESVENNHMKYKCGVPGATTSKTGLAGCTWSFGTNVPGYEDDLSPYLRLVLPVDYENPVVCESDLDCGTSGHICGVHPQRWANGAYKGGVEQGSCGEHVAWVSAGGACAGGWTSGEFPDTYPFFCGETVNNGQRANLYGCNTGPLAHSGYTPGADSTACGCPDWETAGIDSPPISECQGVNPDWTSMAQPWAQHLKKGCPTAYTFPYDDQTSTFSCTDGEEGDPDFINTQSYTITFCHDKTETAMYP